MNQSVFQTDKFTLRRMSMQDEQTLFEWVNDTVTRKNSLKMFWSEKCPKNSQDFPTACHDAGQFLWGRPEAFLEEKTIIFSERALGFAIPRHRVMDIDTLEDWQHAEALYARLMVTKDGVGD